MLPRTIPMPCRGNEWPCGAQPHMMALPYPALWRDDKYPYCVIRLCRGLAMNGYAVRNLTGWYGYTPCCGVMINAMSCTIPALWCGNQWLVMMQPHRGCTFDSPGLPTIGGYPGEQGVRDATPLGVVLSFFVLLNALHVTIRGIASS